MRIPKLEGVNCRVIKQSRRLTDYEKHVWLEVWLLDDPDKDDGCFLSLEILAERLGRTTVSGTKAARRRLRALGLVVSQPKPPTAPPERRTRSWFCTLPEECVARNSTPDELTRRSALLDEHVSRFDSSTPGGHHHDPHPRSGGHHHHPHVPSEGHHHDPQGRAGGHHHDPPKGHHHDLQGGHGHDPPYKDEGEGEGELRERVPHPSPSREGEDSRQFGAEWRRELGPRPESV